MAVPSPEHFDALFCAVVKYRQKLASIHPFPQCESTLTVDRVVELTFGREISQQFYALLALRPELREVNFK